MKSLLLLVCISGRGDIRGHGNSGPVRSSDYAIAMAKSNAVDDIKAQCFRAGGNSIGAVYYGNHDGFCK